MKDRALEIVASRPPAADGRNVLREYLQSRVLSAMQEAGAMVPLAFMGGTALRFLYRISRFSEDLDFTVERNRDSFDFRGLVKDIERTLTREGYALRMRVNDKRAVAKAYLGFAGLPAEAGLSSHAEEVLSLRLEIDTNPPAGAGLAITLVDRHGPLRLQHHNPPSLFAGKIAVVLAREYTKGRDLYDLMWYLLRDDPLEPNPTLLANAIMQTAPELAKPAAEDWRSALRRKLASVDWRDTRRDVAPFLELSKDLELITPETFEKLLVKKAE